MKDRLDILLVRSGFFSSREKAKATIMAGQVYVNGQKEDKAGMKFDTDAQIEVRGKTLRYVSRGGLKLEKAVDTFSLDLEGKVCMDVGASTGGFTDCMLQNGAVRVYAVDVGHGQLDWKLREDDRVICMERFNAREMTPEDLPEQVQFCSIDVSFISLKLILGPVMSVLETGGEIVALIKPQFEAGREKVGKKGVVRDPAVHEEVIRDVLDHAKRIGLIIEDLTWSPITGPEGNIEYLTHLRKEVPDGLTEGLYEEDSSIRKADDSGVKGSGKEGFPEDGISRQDADLSDDAKGAGIDICKVVRLAHEALSSGR